MKTKKLLILLVGIILNLNHLQAKTQTFHGLQFSTIPTIWDEAIPLGNGIIGNLIWGERRKFTFSIGQSRFVGFTSC